MKKITFIVFIALNICLIVLGIIMFFIKYTSAIKYAIVSLSSCYIYFIGWLLGYDAGSVEQKAKNKPRLYLPLDKPNEHDEIAQIVEAQRIYANSKNKKVCKKCVNCKHFVNDCVCLYKGVLAVGSREIANRFNNCEYFEAKDL